MRFSWLVGLLLGPRGLKQGGGGRDSGDEQPQGCAAHTDGFEAMLSLHNVPERCVAFINRERDDVHPALIVKWSPVPCRR